MSDNFDDLAALNARVLAMRDVLTQLLALEARRSPNANRFFQAISNATDARIHEVMKGTEQTHAALQGLEAIRYEVDWMIGAAQGLLRGDANT